MKTLFHILLFSIFSFNLLGNKRLAPTPRYSLSHHIKGFTSLIDFNLTTEARIDYNKVGLRIGISKYPGWGNKAIFGFNSGFQYNIINKKNIYFAQIEHHFVRYTMDLLTTSQRWNYRTGELWHDQHLCRVISNTISISIGANWKIFKQFYTNLAIGGSYIHFTQEPTILGEYAYKHPFSIMPYINIGFAYFFPFPKNDFLETN